MADKSGKHNPGMLVLAAFVVFAMFFAGSASAQTIVYNWTGELATNGGFEAGSLTGWTTSGSWAVGNHPPSGQTGPQAGSYAAYVTSSSSSARYIYQDVNVTAYASYIDNGAAVLNASGWGVSSEYWTNPAWDQSRVQIMFLNSAKTVLSIPLDTGYINSQTWWSGGVSMYTIPANTRYVRLWGNTYETNYDSGSVDSFSAKLGYVVSSCTGPSGQSCEIDNGEGTQTRTCVNYSWTDWSTCTVVSCDAGYVQLGNTCVFDNCTGPSTQSCYIENGTGSQSRTCFDYNWMPWGTCTVTSCDAGYVQIGNVCALDNCTGPSTQSCEIANGEGTQSRTCDDYNWLPWDTCMAVSCDTGYVQLGNVCALDNCTGPSNQSCEIENGTGTQTRTCEDYNWLSWGTCTVDSCDAGYVQLGNTCVFDNCTGPSTQSCYIENGTGSQSRTCFDYNWMPWGACAVVSCDSGFYQSGGECLETCMDTCSSMGYQCGTQTVCGNVTNCGTCGSGYICNANGTCEVPLIAWTGELMINGGFEAGNLTGWTTSGSWAVGNHPPSGQAGPQAGSYAAYVTSSSSTSRYIYQDVNITDYAGYIDEGNAMVTASGWGVSSEYWANPAWDQSRIQMMFLNSAKAVLSTPLDTGYLSIQTWWKANITEYQVPENARYVRVWGNTYETNYDSGSLDSFSVKVGYLTASCSGSPVQTCAIENGVGTQSRTCTAGNWSEWGTCTVVSCNSGYVQLGNMCALDNCTGSPIQSCYIANGTGTQSRTCTDGTWSSWGTCTVASCDAGYYQAVNSCEPCTSHATSSCYGGDVYWYDICGTREDLRYDCNENQTCSAGACIDGYADGQIVADHTVIDDFDKIPSCYIDQVKTMMVAFPGESHSVAYREGMELLEAQNSTYAAHVGTGEAYTDDYVRVENYGWVGEYFWWIWYAIPPQSRPDGWLKEAISDYNAAGHPFSALGFGWCADMTSSDDNVSGTIDPVYGVHWYGRSELGPNGSLAWGLDPEDTLITKNSVNLQTYFGAMEDLISYAAVNSPDTNMVFTTGPVDALYGEFVGEAGYQGHLKHEAIRDYVAENSSRILFDYADILVYDDDGNMSTQTWNGHTYPVITPTNNGDESIGHIGAAGAIRLAKAQWWMLARIAGWDGVSTTCN